jgi:RimJ/RimL family protein N-acetyltransferase
MALDGLHWLDRKGARRAVVNTQVGNEAAYRLYLRLGFRPQPSDLVVLRRELG